MISTILKSVFAGCITTVKVLLNALHTSILDNSGGYLTHFRLKLTQVPKSIASFVNDLIGFERFGVECECRVGDLGIWLE